DSGRGNYNAALMSLQRRLKNGFSVLGNCTLANGMNDPATPEITGPTIVNPADPDLDYSYCASDRRHVAGISAVWRTPTLTNHTLSTIFGEWQLSPILRGQNGKRD